MDNLEELKQINDDLPFTKFPDEIDEYTPFSDADDNINNMISRYRTLMKQGNITEANTIYQEYNLGSYIIGAKFLNKIQHMIIACERAISSVKKYFTFSINEPDGSIAQPNGYVWGKILSAQNGFKNVLLRLKESGSYSDIYPITTIDNVWKSEKSGITETLTDVIQNLDNNKMDKNNPKGTGSLALNYLETEDIGENAVILGSNCSATGKDSFSCGRETVASNNYSSAFGYKTESSGVNEFVIGKYNIPIDNRAFIIGGGDSKDSKKNIFDVDWDGNVKGNSFTATSDIIYDDGKSLKALNENFEILKTSNESISKAVTEHNKLLSNNFVIKSISSGVYDTSVNGGAVSEGESITFNIEANMDVNDNLILIPYYTSKYTNADLRMFSSNTSTKVIGTSKTLTVTATLENISSGEHNLIVYWYAIIYTKLNAY